ncbi:MAG: 23S rRNA (uracil(1939)-C(5))-methyltransferase RlmD [Bacteroidales bacterium]|nr:23S rRNA (uracil(1939)-C(5))-methyltransferase RlmD [Candidatus Egerieousia equi]
MSRHKKKNFELENVLIEGIAAEGNAVAHIDGKALFVPQCVPGDVVNVFVCKDKKKYMQGYVTEIVKKSPDHLEPFCEHFGTCGGCSWEILPYPMQLENKRQQVVDQFVRIGHLEIPESGVEPTLGSEKTTCYRNKLEYTFSNRRWVENKEEADSLSDSEKLGVGFHISGLFDKVLDLKKCHLQCEPSNEIRLFIKKYSIDKGLSFYDLRNQVGFMRNLMIRITSTGEIMLLVVFGPDAIKNCSDSKFTPKAEALELLEAIRVKYPQITSLQYCLNPKCNDALGDLPCVVYSGNDAVYEKMENLSFKIGPKSFYQTNSDQAYRLYSIVRQAIKDNYTKDSKPVVYDLYTGTGTIGLFLSHMAEKVIGIEYVPEAIEDAKVNARNNNIGNAEFIAGDMKDILVPDFIKGHGTPDIVVLDPPRAGIHPDVAQVLLDTAAPLMVYVSCNPASQARDLEVLSKKYRIVRIQPVDMFPHTVHVENVVTLKLKEQYTVVRKEITEYVENQILPQYNNYDKGHQQGHIRAVIDSAMHLSHFYDVDKEMIYTAAAFHDIGICEGRENHHIVSGRIIRDDRNLKKWFTAEQIEIIAQAAEDHRASSKNEPRGVYGKILAEADRQIDPETVIRRTIEFGQANEPEYDKEQQWQRMCNHLEEKYGENGYLKLWIPESPNAAKLAELRKIIADKVELRRIYEKYVD